MSEVQNSQGLFLGVNQQDIMQEEDKCFMPYERLEIVDLQTFSTAAILARNTGVNIGVSHDTY